MGDGLEKSAVSAFVIRQKDPEPLNHNNLKFGHIYLDADGYYSYRVYKQEYTKILLLVFKDNVYLNKNKIKWESIIESTQNSLLPTFNEAPARRLVGWCPVFKKRRVLGSLVLRAQARV